VLYHCDEFNDARPFFEKVLQVNKNDKVAQIYLKRCKYFQKYGVSDDCIGSAGIDLRACIKEPLTIQANETQLIGSGIAINIHNPSMAAVLLPRSGLGVNYGIVLARS